MERKSTLTLGSLFDGSGGFPLAAMMAGIRPVWASETEPFPIRVTKKRFPWMTHLGDVRKVKGSEAESVDIITFGSPCQDLSVAGTRDGLEGSRSSLFHEAVRIVKEMRDATDGRYPRYIVWENVPGAFSSREGRDFHEIISSIIGIRFGGVSVPVPGKWSDAGLVMAEDFSLAWRVLDAQYWGLPQRRKRIWLVADLDGEGAGKILFDSESLPWDSEKDTGEGKESSRSTDEGAGGTGGRPVFWSTSKSNHHTAADMNIAGTLVASDWKDPPTIFREGEQAVRRLTPDECGRLQGFPDGWCDGLGDDDPSDEEMTFWRSVFSAKAETEERYKLTRSDDEIRKWLKNPRSDPAEYRMWGNGIALPCARYVMTALAHHDKEMKRK